MGSRSSKIKAREAQERLDRKRQERLERERHEWVIIERERQERLMRERQERLMRERQERLERERQERLMRERQERLERERQEWVTIERERQERLMRQRQERLERERQERLEKERQERLMRERQERLERERQERLMRERQERLERERQERLMRERQERLERERQERLERERQERLERERQERFERERLAREIEERQRKWSSDYLIEINNKNDAVGFKERDIKIVDIPPMAENIMEEIKPVGRKLWEEERKSQGDIDNIESVVLEISDSQSMTEPSDKLEESKLHKTNKESFFVLEISKEIKTYSDFNEILLKLIPNRNFRLENDIKVFLRNEMTFARGLVKFSQPNANQNMKWACKDLLQNRADADVKVVSMHYAEESEDEINSGEDADTYSSDDQEISRDDVNLFAKLAIDLNSAAKKASDNKRLVTLEIASDHPQSSEKKIKDYIRNIIPGNISYSVTNINIDRKSHMIVGLKLEDIICVQQLVEAVEANSCNTQIQIYVGDYQIQKLVEENWKEVEVKAKKYVNLQEKKVSEISHDLNVLKNLKNIPFSEFIHVQEKKEALQSKRDELIGQLKEFDNFVTSLKKEFNRLVESNQIKIKLLELRKSFGMECLRLDAALPIYAKRSYIMEALKDNQVCVVIGETGSGKSTQIVQYLHQAGYASSGRIICTQPRKVAAQSLAKRVAEEMGCRTGELVGYRVGMHAKMGCKTDILYVTDHVLLNECIKDPTLSHYSCIIIDEAHERTIYTDLLIGMIRRCLDARSELKVIITSATIDPEIFVNYFGTCPVLKSSGKLFPVDVFWKKPSEPKNENYLEEAVQKVKYIHQQEGAGDVLVFLTTPLETEKGCEKLKNDPRLVDQLEVLPLHGRLQPQDQQKIFMLPPNGKRKVVFATNSAETSITIPGIKYIVDTGKVKERRYDSTKNMSSLIVTWINKSSAEQRKGRAGRTQSGKCYRLYTEEDFKAMEAMALPEILRVHLGMALLKLMDLGIDNPLSFEFLQSPPHDALTATMEVLRELGALNEGSLTPLGQQMAKFSVEPRLSRLILTGIEQGIGYECLAIAAMSTVGSNIFFRMGSEAEKEEADKQKMKFCSSAGDFVTMLNVFREWHQASGRIKNKWCRDHSINAKSMRMSRDTLNDFYDVLSKELKLTVDCHFAEVSKVIDLLPKILLQCFSENIGLYSGHKRLGYFLVKPGKVESVAMHPSSCLQFLGSVPQLVVYEQVMKTSQNFMMTITPIAAEWLNLLPNAKEIKQSLKMMERYALSTRTVAQLGRTLTGKILQNRAEKLKTWEERGGKIHDCHHVILDLKKNEGVLTCTTRTELHDTVKLMVQSDLLEFKSELKAETHELPLGSHGKVRIVIECGGIQKQVLMPDEFKAVFLHKVPNHYSIKQLKNELSIHGKISDVKDCTSNKQRNDESRMFSTKTVKVTFDNTDDAKLAVLKGHEDFIVKPERGTKNNDGEDFKVIFTWNRRKATGIAFVELPSIEHVQMVVERCRCNTLYINNNNVRVKVSNKDPKQLFLANLDDQVTKEDVKDAITQYISTADIQNIGLPREKIGTTTSAQLDALQAQLTMKITNIICNKEFAVRVIQPSDTAIEFKAIVTFVHPQDGAYIVEEMDHNAVIQGKTLAAKADLKASVSVSPQIYRVLDIMKELENEKLKMDIEFSTKVLKFGHHIIEVHTNTVEDLLEIKKKMDYLTKGKILQCRSFDMFRNLMSISGQQMLKQVMQKRNSFIHIDPRVSTISVYGTDDSIKSSLKDIEKHLEKAKDTVTIGISLLCSNHPPGIMRELVVRYGPDLNTLRKECGAYALDLMVRRHVLKVTGSEKSQTKVLDIVHKVSEDVASRIITHHHEMTGENIKDSCPICFCEIDDDIYRLEYCGHGYCKLCIVMLIVNGVRSRELPITCALEGCDEPLVIRDFLNLTSPEEKDQLVLAAVDHFMLKNSQYKCCITPNCPMFYQVTSTQDSFKCPLCNISICTACHVQYHVGFSCDMYKASKGDVDFGLKEYLKKDRKNRAPCPKCNTPIEKNGGCNHVTCAACNIHICWSCKKTFPTSTVTYDHMARCQGIFPL